MIEVIGLSKKYGNKQILSEITITFNAGSIYGLVGKNGAGKSTFFKCLAGLEKFNGAVKSEFPNLKNHIGLLETNPMFISRITGWEYLRLVCMAREIKSAEFEKQNIFELPLNQYVENYSTGMKKKLALLGTILQKNEVFILDEPFNGVDIQSNIIILEIIKELKKKGKIILIASHIFSTLNEICDRILFLDSGMIAKDVDCNGFSEIEDILRQQIVSDKISSIQF